MGVRADMLTERAWAVVLKMFRGCLSRRGEEGVTTCCSCGPCT